MYFLLVLTVLVAIVAGIYLAYKYRLAPTPTSGKTGSEMEILSQLNDLLEKAVACQKSDKLDEAENAYRKILKLRRQQAKDNPVHHVDVAITLNNLGNLYSDMHKYDLAEAAYAEALEIYRLRSSENPAWLPYVGRTLNNFATLCLFSRQIDRAEKLSREGVEVLRQCWNENPDRYGDDFAKTLLVLAYVLTSQKDQGASVLALAKEAELAATEKDIKLKAQKMIEKLIR